LECLELRKNLLLYVDNELSGEAAQAFRQHLECCPACRSRADSEERFRALLRERLSLHSAPPGLREKIRARLAEESAGSRRGIGTALLFRPAVAAGLAVLLTLMLLAPFLTQRKRPGGGIHAHFSGRLVCVQCEKMGVPLALQKRCTCFRHATGLRLGNGRIINLADTESAAALLTDPSLRGHQVAVDGILYGSIATMLVEHQDLL